MHKKIVPMLQIVLIPIAVFASIFGMFKLLSKFSLTIAFSLSVLLACLFIYAYFIEPNILTITYKELEFANFPCKKPVKILQISDLHYNTDGIIYEKVLKTVKKENPDFVVITGDFIGDSGKSDVVNYCKKIVNLKIPVYAVMGNWDHHEKPGATKLEIEIKSAGVKILPNANEEVCKNFFIAGTDDPYFGYANLRETFKGIPPNAFVILLTHSPDIIYEAAKYEPQLILCGHTHGGQVKVPFVKAIYVPSKYGTRFLEGMFKIGKSYMYVNRGIGESHLRIRFLSPPEITVFTLRKE